MKKQMADDEKISMCISVDVATASPIFFFIFNLLLGELLHLFVITPVKACNAGFQERNAL